MCWLVIEVTIEWSLQTSPCQARQDLARLEYEDLMPLRLLALMKKKNKLMLGPGQVDDDSMLVAKHPRDVAVKIVKRHAISEVMMTKTMMTTKKNEAKRQVWDLQNPSLAAIPVAIH